MLGAYKHSSWIPVVVGFSSMFATLLAYHGVRPELTASNVALGTLKRVQVDWASSSNVDRRTPKFKRDLVTLIEDQALAVVMAVVGSAAVTAKKEESEQGDGEKDKKNDKKNGKSQ
eukprot:gnl/TRDRNA2_/TRDRNA2_177043_c2_seq10.p2 gnl/TRDRNA2_/TRDRNA2_177043_c2~~gnl/TRDRNA2_/TRDRNA2_177043_c2_seq10.p2  ORF type:complete len:116 (-),score=24.90 gnl/TRDRNA2_/TRDRNA2_177043_c2_seq10:342-689(-)